MFLQKRGVKHHTTKTMEKDRDVLIEELLERPYWIVDILPCQVPKGAKGQYFTIERYMRSLPQIDRLCRKFTSVVLKLNCYDNIAVRHPSEGWVDNPSPETLERWVGESMRGGGSLYIVSDSTQTMLAIGDDAYMTLYNAELDELELVRLLATSEGLYVWQPSADVFG